MSIKNRIIDAIAPELVKANTELETANLSMRKAMRNRHRQHDSRLDTIKDLNTTIVRLKARIADLEGNPIATIEDVKAAAKTVNPQKVMKYREYIENERQRGIVQALRALVSAEDFARICDEHNAMSDEELDTGWGISK